MNNVWKHIALGLFVALAATGFALSYIEGQKVRSSIVCNSIEIDIRDSSSNHFLSRENIAHYIDREYGRYEGINADSIRLTKIEEILKRKSAVRNSEAYITRDGCLHVEVVQKNPFVRFQSKGHGYYVDTEGNIFPLQATYSARVPVIDGFIPAQNDTAGIMRYAGFMQMLQDSKDWSGRIVHISIDEKGNLTLYPKTGKEKFLFGQLQDIEGKLEKMGIYYTHIAPAKEDAGYVTIDLKYRNQIVCK